MTTPFRIFNLDLHTSVIEDFKAVCATLFGTDRVEITNWSISRHNIIFNKPTTTVVGITQQSWTSIDETTIQQFQDAYDEQLKTYDAFVVTHTPVFVMLFEKYKKPIIVINSCRYDQPFCFKPNPSMRAAFHACLQRLLTAGLLHLVSNNYSDEVYLRKGTGLQSTVLPSLCLYMKDSHAPTQQTFVCFGERTFFPQHPLLVSKPPPGYTWADLYSTRGFVHVPYEMSTMSIFEQYWSGAPLFFPTKEYYKDCLFEGRLGTSFIYTDSTEGDLTEEEIDQWLDTADFYKLPYIYYYSSEQHLLQMLETFEDVYKVPRLLFIEQQVRCHLQRWKAILEPLCLKRA